jgi:hypothetical protein
MRRASALRRVTAVLRALQAAGPRARPAGAEYLYLACVSAGGPGAPAAARRWVQPVPIVRKTAKLIYYTSDSWDRRAAVVSPGCISWEQFAAGRPFFATRQAAEDYLFQRERAGAGQARPPAPSVRQLRQVMVSAHPDRGGTAEQFIRAHRRYQDALRSARC